MVDEESALWSTTPRLVPHQKSSEPPIDPLPYFDFVNEAEDDWLNNFLSLDPELINDSRSSSHPNPSLPCSPEQLVPYKSKTPLRQLPTTTEATNLPIATSTESLQHTTPAKEKNQNASNIIDPEEWEKVFLVVSSLYTTHTLSEMMEILDTKYNFKARSVIFRFPNLVGSF